MKYQSLIITLCITTLTACAVDKSDEAQVTLDDESQRRVEERVREISGKKAEDEYVIISTPEPKEHVARDDGWSAVATFDHETHEAQVEISLFDTDFAVTMQAVHFQDFSHIFFERECACFFSGIRCLSDTQTERERKCIRQEKSPVHRRRLSW